MKKCNRCKEVKSFTDFNRCTSAKDGLQYSCRACNKEFEQTRNRKRTSEYAHNCYRREKLNSPERFLLSRVKQRAKKRGLQFDLDVTDIVIPLVNHAPRKNNLEGYKEDSPSVDRIDSAKGYLKGNIIICSAKANVIKNYGTLEDHRKIVEFLEKYENKNSLS